MDKVKIIYTPETDLFRQDDITLIWRGLKPGDPRSAVLRENYRKLREKISDLPSEVGVVTYADVFKKAIKAKYDSMRDDIAFPKVTSYMQLDVLEAILALKKEDSSDPIARQYASRILMYLPSLMLIDKSLSESEIDFLFKSVLTPENTHFTKEYKESLAKFEGTNPSDEKREVLEKTMKLMRDVITELEGIAPKWEDFETMHRRFLEQFNANQVSREFPLYHFANGWFFPSSYAVSLVDEIEIPEHTREVMRYIEVGCKASGTEVPEDVKQHFLEQHKDKFGITERVYGLDRLLKKLPEPKTVITDLYIVDNFPELKGNIEPMEIRLE